MKTRHRWMLLVAAFAVLGLCLTGGSVGSAQRDFEMPPPPMEPSRLPGAEVAPVKPWQEWACFRSPFQKQELITPGTPADLAEPKVSSEILQLAFEFEDWLNFDSDALVRRIAGAIETAPSDPAVIALLHALQEVFEESDLTDMIGEAVRSAVAAYDGKPERALGGNARYLLEAHYEVAMRQAQWEEARAIERAMLGLQQWLVIGPFAPRGGGDATDLSFPLDRLVSISAPVDGAFGPVEWQPFEPDRPNDARVTPADLVVDNGNGWYMLTEVVNSGPARQVLLDVEAGTGGFAVWLGGRMMMHRRQGRDMSRDDARVVELPAGVSSLLIKLGSGTSCAVRICDPESRLVLPSVTSRRPEAASFKPFVPEGRAASLDRRVPGAFQRLAAAHLAAATGSEMRGMTAAILALVMADAGVAELAEDYWQDCKAWREADPIRDACLGYWYFDRPTVASPARERSEMRSRLNRMLELRPDAVRPRIELARILTDERQEVEAARLLEEAASLKPHWRIHQTLAEFYRRQNWQAEAAHYEKLLGDGANGLFALRDHAEALANAGNTSGAAEVLDAALGRWPGASTLLWRRLSIAIDRGEFALAESLLEREVLRSGGEGRDQLASRVRLRIAQGQWLAAYEILLELGDTPRREGAQALADAASLAVSRGDPDRAEQAWRLLLFRWPGDDRARRALALLLGEPVTELPGHMTRVDHELLWQVEAADYPKASAAVLLDEQVWRVWEDGGGEVYGQRVTKVLSMEAIDWHGRATVPGEVIRARTLLPDYTQAEPATVTGGRFEFPRIGPGAATDFAWRDVFRGDGWRTLHGRSFSFASSDLTMPTLQSRLVVELPPGMEVRYQGVGLERVTIMRVAREDGGTILTFELNRPRSIDPEPLMPRVSEVVPSVTFLSPAAGSVGPVARRLVDEISEPQVTWLVRETAQAIGQELVDSGKQVTARSFAEEAFHWVNHEIRGAGAGFHPHSTLVDGQGNRQDLFVALLDAAGLDWRMARLSGGLALSSSGDFESPSFPWTLIQVVDEAGVPFMVDMGERMAAFGSVRRQLFGSRMLTVSPRDLSWQLGSYEPALPPEDGYHLEALISLVDAEDRPSRVTGKLTYAGEPAFAEKESARNTPNERLKLNTEADLSSYLPGLTIAEVDPELLELRGTPYVRKFSGTLLGVLQDTGDGMVMDLPLEAFAFRYRTATSLPERQFDLMLGSAFSQTEAITVWAPFGMAWASVPEGIELADPAFSYSLRLTVTGRELKLERSFRVYQRRVPAADYGSFRRRVLAIDALESSQLKLVAVE